MVCARLTILRYLHIDISAAVSYFAVYDGHAGAESSTYLEAALHKNIFNKNARKLFRREQPVSEEDVIFMIKKGFKKTEEDLLQQLRLHGDWSCVSISLLFPQPFLPPIYCLVAFFSYFSLCGELLAFAVDCRLTFAEFYDFSIFPSFIPPSSLIPQWCRLQYGCPLQEQDLCCQPWRLPSSPRQGQGWLRITGAPVAFRMSGNCAHFLPCIGAVQARALVDRS